MYKGKFTNANWLRENLIPVVDVKLLPQTTRANDWDGQGIFFDLHLQNL